MRTPLTDDEYRRVHDWLLAEYGLKFGPEKRDILRSRLEPLRVDLGFDTFEKLFFHLRYHPSSHDNRDRLIPYLTNNESYFYREVGQLEALVTEVIGETVDRLSQTGRREVRITSAGCASGEEPYTIAMMLADSRRISPDWRLRITGVDLDHQALARAEAGAYSRNAFRRIEPAMQRRHFEVVDESTWKLRDPIRKMVEFKTANITNAHWTSEMPRQDIIFCRNVMIYFDEAATLRALEGFYSLLDPGGFLFLGHSETLSRVPTRFVPVRRPGALFYQRPVETA